jgi:hypothetical protein
MFELHPTPHGVLALVNSWWRIDAPSRAEHLIKASLIRLRDNPQQMSTAGDSFPNRLPHFRSTEGGIQVCANDRDEAGLAIARQTFHRFIGRLRVSKIYLQGRSTG